MSKNTRFLATPRAAKVAKGPLGTNGPHWGGQKNAENARFSATPKAAKVAKGPLGANGGSVFAFFVM